MADINKVINISQWIQLNNSNFLPPVMNKLMHGDDVLKVMFVGGPNVRSDFHIEEGEEVFIQIKGSMVLRVQVDAGIIRDIEIKEGQIFLLPARMPHSPQRFPNTVGFVMERLRSNNERDALRYYVDGNDNEVLWEKWFHLDNLVADLPVAINEFKQSEQCISGKPTAGFLKPPPFKLNSGMKFLEPFDIKTWLERNKESLRENHKASVFGSKMQTKVMFYSSGEINCSTDALETFLWLWEGEATVTVDDSKVVNLTEPHDSVLIKPMSGYKINVAEGGYLLSMQMPMNCKPY